MAAEIKFIKIYIAEKENVIRCRVYVSSRGGEFPRLLFSAPTTKMPDPDLNFSFVFPYFLPVGLP